jgi:serine/threonine-protein kinase
MPIVSVSSLIDALREHQLLEPAQFVELTCNLQPRFTDARALARELLERDWLTAYQANQIFLDRGADLVLGPYVLLERLGEGGMGQVFKARHTKLDRIVALKVIRKERLVNPEMIRRFHREIQAAAQLCHPNIVLAYDADEVGGTHFFAMEYVAGVDLAKVLRQRGRLPLDEACDYVRQAALGLQHISERGLVHRDIKPSNLLLAVSRSSQQPSSERETASGNLVKILDLGLARIDLTGDEQHDATSTLTEEGMVMGTLEYLAPEQVRNAHTVDIRADLYSLGCTFYHFLGGKAPFAGFPKMEKLFKHQFDEPPPLEQLRPEVSPDVARIIRRLIAKRPADRFQTPAELAAALATAAIARAVPVGAMASDEMATEAYRPPATLIAHEAAPDTAEQFAALARPPSTEETPSPLSERGVAQKRRLVRLTVIAGLGLLVALTVLVRLLHQEVVPDAPEKPPPPELPFRFQFPRIPVEDVQREHPEGLIAIYGDQRLRHWGQVYCVAISPEGDLIASGGEDRVIRWWDPATGRQKVVLKAHTHTVTGLAFSQDGRTLASVCLNGLVKLWDPEIAREKGLLKGHMISCRGVAFSPEAKILVTAAGDWSNPNGPGEIKFWDLTTRQEIDKWKWSAAQGPVVSVAWSGDGKTVAWSQWAGNVYLWDVATAKVRATIETKTPQPRLAFSPDSKQLAMGLNNGDVRLVEVATGKMSDPFAAGPPIFSVAFAPDGNTLAIGRTTGVQLLDLKKRPQQPLFLPGLSDTAWSLAFLRDGKTLVIGSGELVRLWNFKSNQELHPARGHLAPVSTLAFSPDQLTLATGSDDATVRLWNVTSGLERGVLKEPKGSVNSLIFAPDGRTLFAGWHHGFLRRYDTASLNALSDPGPQGAPVSQVSIAPDGKSVIAMLGNWPGTPSPDWKVLRWDVESWKARPLPLPAGGFRRIAVAPDWRTAAWAELTPTVAVRDLDTGAERARLTGHANYSIGVMAFGGEGKRLAVGSYAEVKVWELDPARDLATLHPAIEWVRAVALSADGKMVATAGKNGQIGVVSVFDVGAKNPKPIQEWKLPGLVNALSFAQDTEHLYLATANYSGTAHILRVK